MSDKWEFKEYNELALKYAAYLDQLKKVTYVEDLLQAYLRLLSLG